jgi:CelD/BcsL family acetyltransferase involved in cellulose biosynthesis
VALRAEIVGADVGLRACAAADACDATAGFAGSAPWLRAAHAALGDDRLVHCVLHAADGREVGVLALERTRADWRSGSPGRMTLAWPFAELGYSFGPRWLVPAAAPGDWLRALRVALPGTRLELRRCDPARVPPRVDDGVERTEGIGTWRLEAPGDVDGWLASLRGKHRRDLHKGLREIAAGGAVWCDAAHAEAQALDAVFALHRARLDSKGVAAGAVGARGEAFLRALAAQTDAGVRLTTLQHAGRHVAGCLSFVARGEYLAFVSGWDRVHTR